MTNLIDFDKLCDGLMEVYVKRYTNPIHLSPFDAGMVRKIMFLNYAKTEIRELQCIQRETGFINWILFLIFQLIDNNKK